MIQRAVESIESKIGKHLSGPYKKLIKKLMIALNLFSVIENKLLCMSQGFIVLNQTFIIFERCSMNCTLETLLYKKSDRVCIKFLNI